MVAIKGRRRIGKSRLATQFASLQAKSFFSFTGLAPDTATTAQQQLVMIFNMEIAAPFLCIWGI